MSELGWIREQLALRHVERHEDHLVQEYVQMLLKRRERLRVERRTMAPKRLARSGRQVVARVVTGVAIALSLVVFGEFGYNLVMSSTFRKGVVLIGTAAVRAGKDP